MLGTTGLGEESLIDPLSTGASSSLGHGAAVSLSFIMSFAELKAVMANAEAKAMSSSVPLSQVSVTLPAKSIQFTFLPDGRSEQVSVPSTRAQKNRQADLASHEQAAKIRRKLQIEALAASKAKEHH
jgi:hypothetical protein